MTLRSLFLTLPGAILLAGSCLLAQPVAAQPVTDGEAADYFRELPDSRKFFLTIVGAAASPEILDRQKTWVDRLQATLVEDYGYAQNAIRLLFGDGAAEGAQGSSRREDIEAGLTALQQAMNPGDQLTVLLIGHGSGSGNDAKFNIVGPDITGGEFAELLTGFAGSNLVIVNTTSASFEFSERLSAPGRVNISATRSRAERFDPMFADYFIEALEDRRGDRDKNGRVSMLEAFTYANVGVTGWYEEQGRLPTEHAVLDDSGDAMFTLEPSPQIADGRLAEIAYVDIPMAGDEKESPEAQQLLLEIQDVERSIFMLRGQKVNYLEDDYWRELEALLIDLARKTGAYDALP